MIMKPDYFRSSLPRAPIDAPGELGPPFIPRRMLRAREVAELALDFEPNGLCWSNETSRLYVADDTHARLMAWDGRELQQVVEIPADCAEARRLGQPSLTSTGDVLLPRYGYGHRGGVFKVNPRRRSFEVLARDPSRKRLGVLELESGGVLATYFTGCRDERQGGLARIAPDGTEVDVSTGLGKPVSIVALGDAIYVSDQADDCVVRAPRERPSILTTFARVKGPDALSPGPGGTLLVASRAGEILVLDRLGRSLTLVTSLEGPRGLAYDGRRTMFIAERIRIGPNEFRGRLRILDLEWRLDSGPRSARAQDCV